MQKLFTLVKKELREMITPQVIIPAVVMVLIFMFIGDVVGKEAKKSKAPQNIIVLDNDGSGLSGEAIEVLKNSNFNVSLLSKTTADEAIKTAKEKNISVVLAIPAGFGDGIGKFKPQKIETYAIMKNFSLQGNQSKAILDASLAAFNNFVSDRIIASRVKGGSPADLKNPIQREDNVIIGDRMAKVNASAIIGFVQSQATFLPIILFMIITLAATIIATAIATEKENKTLETLLTVPVDRRFIIMAKMIGAGTVALIMAGIYIVGFSFYLKGLTGQTAGAGNIGGAAEALGLVITPGGYALLGLTIFLGILCALSIATVIGSFAQDAKGVQGLISPLMIMLLIPYLLLMLIDINSAGPALKYLVYAIPFSYTFLGIQNIFLKNYSMIFFGLGYSLAFFTVFVLIAGKIFSSDKIITLKINFRRKKL
ncbi:MAG: ABC transporter permease [Patescibacteria group bacterium]|jgi:ABC-2 type transport system permease protein